MLNVLRALVLRRRGCRHVCPSGATAGTAVRALLVLAMVLTSWTMTVPAQAASSPTTESGLPAPAIPAPSDESGATSMKIAASSADGQASGESAPTQDGGIRTWLGWWSGNEARAREDEVLLGTRPRWQHYKFHMGQRGIAQERDLIEGRERMPFMGADWQDIRLSVIMDFYPESKKKGPDLAGIIAGKYDDDLRAIAKAFIRDGHGDAVWRWWHEPDLKNVPHRCHSGVTKDWIAAWRHAHDVVMSVPGAAFVWQYSVNGRAGDGVLEDGVPLLDLCYPGDNYVDDVSVGVYARGAATKAEVHRKSLEKLQRVADFAIAHGKTFSCAEWGLEAERAKNKGTGDDPEFLRLVIDFMNGLPAENRGYCLYFNRRDVNSIRQYGEGLKAFQDAIARDP